LESEGHALIVFHFSLEYRKEISRLIFIQFLAEISGFHIPPFLVLIDISPIIVFINVNLNSFTSPEVFTVIHTCLFALLDLSSNALYTSLC
jgi:hypothetical protein